MIRPLAFSLLEYVTLGNDDKFAESVRGDRGEYCYELFMLRKWIDDR